MNLLRRAGLLRGCGEGRGAPLCVTLARIFAAFWERVLDDLVEDSEDLIVDCIIIPTKMLDVIG